VLAGEPSELVAASSDEALVEVESLDEDVSLDEDESSELELEALDCE
jgi:hypothetical protein